VTWAIYVPILVFLGLSVLELRAMYATDSRQTKASLNARPIRGGGIIINLTDTERYKICAENDSFMRL